MIAALWLTLAAWAADLEVTYPSAFDAVTGGAPIAAEAAIIEWSTRGPIKGYAPLLRPTQVTHLAGPIYAQAVHANLHNTQLPQVVVRLYEPVPGQPGQRREVANYTLTQAVVFAVSLSDDAELGGLVTLTLLSAATTWCTLTYDAAGQAQPPTCVTHDDMVGAS